MHVGAASSGDAARICAERGYTLEGRLGAEVYDGSLAATLAEGLAGKAVAV